MAWVEYSLYLQVGDRVFHKRFLRWGMGVVIEERRSELPGGFCYVRINFQDGQVRVFDNNFKSDNCCYYAGIEKMAEQRTARRQARGTERIRKRLAKLLAQLRARHMLQRVTGAGDSLKN
jgi:hypothetical protein